MLDKKDGSPVTEPENPKYDEYGNLLDDSNHIIAQALYTGITNYQGEMIFVHSDRIAGSVRRSFHTKRDKSSGWIQNCFKGCLPRDMERC